MTDTTYLWIGGLATALNVLLLVLRISSLEARVREIESAADDVEDES